VAGVIGVIGFNVVLIALVVVQMLGQFFADFGMMSDFESGTAPTEAATADLPDYDNDVYVILAMAAVLTLLWALAASLDGNPGFTVLAIAMPATLVPTATFVLAIEHPTWWGAAFAVAGGLLLAGAGLLQLRSRRRTV
jgi:hypothetical protein